MQLNLLKPEALSKRLARFAGASLATTSKCSRSPGMISLQNQFTRSYSNGTITYHPFSHRNISLGSSRLYQRHFSNNQEKESDEDEQPSNTETEAPPEERDPEQTQDIDASSDDKEPGRVKQWLNNIMGQGEDADGDDNDEDNDSVLVEKYKAALQQSQADFFNARERHRKELESAREYAMKKFAGDVLQVSDAIETALTQHKKGQDNSMSSDDLVNTLYEGVELTQKQLFQVFERHGVERIDCLGEEFDPNLHEAVSTMPSNDVPKDHVAVIVRDGFRIKDQILRAPMVVVATNPPPPSQSDDSANDEKDTQ